MAGRLGTTLLAAAAVAVAVLAGCGGGGGGGGGDGGPVLYQLSLIPIADGFQRPNYVTSAADGTGRLFVVEQSGLIRVIDSDGEIRAEPFLDLTGIVTNVRESGLLSVAFHPDFAGNGRFFVYFVSDRDGARTTYISEFTADGGAGTAQASPATERIVLDVGQPSDLHNGGMLAFGPEGYLWASLGDGGGSAARDNAQDTESLLGSVLRLDVDGGDPYAIPPGNPFVGEDGRDEIFAYGFRNPWRFSIDPANGRVFVGDVGEARWEEINLIEAGGNYGWPIMEGPDCFPGGAACDTTGLEAPIHAYSHGQFTGVCSVTGGYVYRGGRYPDLRGRYLFADFCSGMIWSLSQSGGQWQATMELDTDLQVTSFGTDADGEMYVVDLNGGIYRMDFAE